MSKELDEAEAVAAAIGQYVDGVERGDVETLRGVFHPDARMFGVYDGEPMSVPIEKLYDLVRERPAPVVSGEPYRWRISAIDVVGETANVVLVEDSYLGHDYVDTFSLVRVAGAWRIVNKTFMHTGPAAAGGAG